MFVLRWDEVAPRPEYPGRLHLPIYPERGITSAERGVCLNFQKGFRTSGKSVVSLQEGFRTSGKSAASLQEGFPTSGKSVASCRKVSRLRESLLQVAVFGRGCTSSKISRQVKPVNILRTRYNLVRMLQPRPSAAIRKKNIG